MGIQLRQSGNQWVLVTWMNEQDLEKNSQGQTRMPKNIIGMISMTIKSSCVCVFNTNQQTYSTIEYGIVNNP